MPKQTINQKFVKGIISPKVANLWRKDDEYGVTEADPKKPKSFVRIDTIVSKKITNKELEKIPGILNKTLGGKWRMDIDRTFP